MSLTAAIRRDLAHARDDFEASPVSKSALKMGLGSEHSHFTGPTSPFFYPLKGLAFMATRIGAFKQFWRSAALYGLVSAVVLAAFFAVAFPPQYSMIADVLGHSWLALQVATGLTFFEAAVPIFILLQFKQADLQNRLFDEVMREVGITIPKALPPSELQELQLAAEARHREIMARLKGVNGVVTGPLFLLHQLLQGRPGEPWLRSWVRLTVTSPLLVFWPYGPMLYAWLNGYAAGFNLHSHYMAMKGVDRPEEQEIVALSRKQQYTRFGAACMLLGMVPAVGWGLSLCSAAGAALWAAEMENKNETLVAHGGAGHGYSMVSLQEV